MGFGELETDGHIDCFYVHHQHQRQGIGVKLYRVIEDKASEFKISRLFTEASITAKPFFASQGFELMSAQQVLCRGEKFTNYLMQKDLRY